MKKLLMLMLFVTISAAGRLQGQIPAATAPKTSATAPQKKAKKKAASEKQDKWPAENLFDTGVQANEPPTREVYADAARFDSTQHLGIFSGRGRVVDPH